MEDWQCMIQVRSLVVSSLCSLSPGLSESSGGLAVYNTSEVVGHIITVFFLLQGCQRVAEDWQCII